MSRSGYTDEPDDNFALIRWRGAVKSALRGARGQAFLRELAAALDAMPEKTLTVGELQSEGEFCALGVVGAARGLDLSKIDTEDWQQLSQVFGIAEAMAREIMFENDECVDSYDWVEIHGPVRFGLHPEVRIDATQVGERRWRYMREWVAEQIAERMKGQA